MGLNGQQMRGIVRMPRKSMSIRSRSSLPADLGEVEDVVDDGQQAGGAVADRFQMIALRPVSLVSSNSSVMPMTPFIGVRISWLMLARNCDFASTANSARSLACSSLLLAHSRSRVRFATCSLSAPANRGGGPRQPVPGARHGHDRQSAQQVEPER